MKYKIQFWREDNNRYIVSYNSEDSSYDDCNLKRILPKKFTYKNALISISINKQYQDNWNYKIICNEN